MVIDLKPIFSNPNGKLVVNEQLDLSEVDFGGGYPFTSPVSIIGTIENKAGVLDFTYKAAFVLELTCDRCLKDLKQSFDFSFSETLVAEENVDADNDEYIFLPECSLVLEELCTTDILLALPSKFLCKEDCKGLCVTCGADLNEAACLCNKKEVDPRLAALSKLLEE